MELLNSVLFIKGKTNFFRISLIQTISKPAFEFIAYNIFSLKICSVEQSGNRKILKQVLAVGSLLSGLSASSFEIVKHGCIEPNPISGCLGQDVTNFSSFYCSSSFMRLSRSFQNCLITLDSQLYPPMYCVCFYKSDTSICFLAPDNRIYSSFSLKILSHFNGIHS